VIRSKVLTALQRTTDRENQITVGYIQKTYMSRPSDSPTSPDGLRVISNRLRGSLRASRTRFDNNGLLSSIGSTWSMPGFWNGRHHAAARHRSEEREGFIF
jgi:hypothetical protein